MNDVSPLYVDGPLKGEQFIPDSLRHPVVTMDLASESQVVYHLHKLKLFGRVIWVGATVPPDEISDADLFDLIVSDRAKQASELPD